MTPINLRAAEARELLDAGRVEVVRVMIPRETYHPLPAPGAVVACREPWGVGARLNAIGDVADGIGYKADLALLKSEADTLPVYEIVPPGDITLDSFTFGWKGASTMPTWAIRLHARVESRGAEVRDGKWCWVAVVVREEKSDGV